MKDTIQKVNNSFNTLVMFILFSGALYFIYYSLEESKPQYLLFSALVYLLGLFVRTRFVREDYDSKFTETGLFFISFLLTAYLLYIAGIDQNIKNYLPDKILIQSGFAFVWFLVIHILSQIKNSYWRFISILVFVGLVLISEVFKDFFNSFFMENKEMANFIIGTPVLYLFMTVFGIDHIIARVFGLKSDELQKIK